MILNSLGHFVDAAEVQPWKRLKPRLKKLLREFMTQTIMCVVPQGVPCCSG